MADLSVLIPARQEMFLQRTVEDVLENMRGDTEIIVVLDGYWPDQGMPLHDRVTIIHRPESIGQRAATNEAARVSRAKYVMKLDAHCAVAQGFDVQLIEDAEKLGDDVMQVPKQFNMHVFDWQCDGCGHRRYQGRTPEKCEKCGHGKLHREMVWKPRKSRLTTAWLVDSNLKFGYFGKFKHRPEGRGDITDTMSMLGACWFVSRERYWALDGLDEGHGGWGQMGIELACKSWLSGGRLVTNHLTHFSHMFRTQGGDFGFPYPLSQRQVRRARKHSQEMWLNNRWPKQIRPLSWLIEKFKPVADWHKESGAKRLAEVAEAGVAFATASKISAPVVDAPFLRGQPDLAAIGAVVTVPASLGADRATSTTGREGMPALAMGSGAARDSGGRRPRGIVGPLADTADAHEASGRLDDTSGRKEMSAEAVGLSCVDGTGGIGPKDVGPVTDERQVGGVAARAVATGDVVNDGDVATPASRQGLDEPSVENPVGHGFAATETGAAVTGGVSLPGPVPAASAPVDADSGEEPTDASSVEVGDCEKLGISHDSASCAESRLGAGGASTSSAPSILPPPPVTKGVVFYSDCRGDETILRAAREQLVRAVNGHSIVSVTLKPVDLGDVRVVMARLERGYLTMFKQILAGLEVSRADVIFLAEHDLLYAPAHFDFTPPRDDIVFYNRNVWKVDAKTGQALHYLCSQTSGLCAYRELILEHYRKRVALVEERGFSRKMGFEAGTHGRSERVDDLKSEAWMSAVPNIDIRHGHNLTPSRWRQDQFRDKRNCKGWTEGDAIPGWGVTKGRFAEFLAGLR